MAGYIRGKMQALAKVLDKKGAKTDWSEGKKTTTTPMPAPIKERKEESMDQFMKRRNKIK